MRYVKSKKYGHGVEWDDKSVSYYDSKKTCLRVIKSEAGKRRLGVKNKVLKNML